MGASPYTRERLAEAAAAANTMGEVMERLGVDPTAATRTYLWQRMKHFGIDTSHFTYERYVRWTREKLSEAVAACSNMTQVLVHLGLDPVGGNHTHISRRVRAMGIDTSHFIPAQRSERMKGNARRRGPEEILVQRDVERGRRVPGARLGRALREIGVPEVCAMCDTGPEWYGDPLPLEVDHIDGDWRNNRPGNLRFLCPNCHSTTDGYRGRGVRRRS
ncbi:HNH endonuclease signature motif containing protein [Streptomyces polyrhachis]|uniref:HNH endonuclease signature motif containing protein n=1 Tax=Streptomyces polyrhachis TaxID=1282885 RepID=A0ABW2GFP3_9ACTN